MPQAERLKPIAQFGAEGVKVIIGADSLSVFDHVGNEQMDFRAQLANRNFGLSATMIHLIPEFRNIRRKQGPDRFSLLVG